VRVIESVLVTLGYEAARLDLIKQACDAREFILLQRADSAGITEALRTVDVALLASDLDERFLSAPKLRWVHCDHAGLNKSARPEVFRRKLLVSGSAGRSSPVLAEHAVFFMLALAYNFPAFYQAQRAHKWGVPGQHELRGIYGKTLGIVGMGHTGTELAARAKALGMRVLGYRRRVTPPPSGVDVLYSAERGDSLDAVLRESDFLVLAVTLSDATHHLIGSKELGQMKKTSFLVNMARGAVVDEAALIDALESHRIAGAGLDTTTVEPLPSDSPLWDFPNVLITPHVTPQVPDRTGRSLEIILENIKRYRSEQPLLNQLTPEDVYTPTP
jgi:phosphoglycerate dehydrogenase-like enzyme